MSTNSFSRVKPVYRNTDVDKPSMISIVSGRICARIRIDDIEYLDQEYRQLHIVTSDTDYVVYDSLSTFAEIIELDTDFYRALKTLIVNFNHVIKIEDDEIFFESGRTVAMGRNNIIKAKTAFKKYLQKYQIMPQNSKGIMVAEKHSKT